MSEVILSHSEAQTNNLGTKRNIAPSSQTPPETPESQNPPKPIYKIFITAGIILMIIVLIVSGYYIFMSQTNKTPNQSSTVPSSVDIPTPTIDPKTALEPPPLYPEFEWEKFTESENNKSLSRNALYSQKGSWGSIQMNGEEWTASKDNLDRDSMQFLLAGFDEYYNLEFAKKGWSNNYEDEQYNFSPLAADGPGGSIRGYIKANNGKLRLVLLEKITPIEDFGGVATCPCNIGFRVFISDTESIEELSKRIN